MTQQSGNPVRSINKTFEERAAQSLAQESGFEYINLSKFPINPDVLQLVDKEYALRSNAIPFFRNGKKIKVAVPSPTNKDAEHFINHLEGKGYVVSLYICSKDSLKEAFESYASHFLTLQTVEAKHDFDEKEGETFEQQFVSFGVLNERIHEMPTEKALNEIEIAAIRTKASDIHIQPAEGKSILRLRMDGILQDICDIEKEIAKKLISRIKYEAGMRSNVSNIPQDGHISFEANDRKVDLRVSTLPTEGLESVVMRVLDSRKGIKKFSELGFEKRIRDLIEASIFKKSGMVLVTGPTGSGKTTTLYSMLAELNSEEKKLVTLEDPVEYHLENVTQSQILPGEGYTFASGLKALLRHDPDIILIGEIREFETAKLATEAALTGHTVLSSLHTNSAINGITRLRNLGLENYNIATSLNAVFAQRLLRKICPNCAKSRDLSEKEKTEIKPIIDRLTKLYGDFLEQKDLDKAQIKSAGKCANCSHTGYIGQTAVCEAFLLTDEIREKIAQGHTEIEIKNYIRAEAKYIDLYEAGAIKVLQGLTTIEELKRVVS